MPLALAQLQTMKKNHEIETSGDDACVQFFCKFFVWLTIERFYWAKQKLFYFFN